MANHVLDTRIMVKGDPSTVVQKDIVFDTNSTSRESRVFQARKEPAVVTGYAIAHDAFIFLEVIEQSPTLAAVNLCDCYIEAQQIGTTISVNRVPCSFQPIDEEGNVAVGRYVMLSQETPMIRIDLPEGTYFRLNWVGSGFGSAIVRLIYTDNADVLNACSCGCPTVTHPDYPNLWTDTGVRRCNLDTNKHEWQYKGPDGQVVWRAVKNLNWMDTGNIRELIRPDTNQPDDDQYQKQQVDDCGDLRWVVTVECIVLWTDTGVTREQTPVNDYHFDKQQVNQFGRFRWVESQTDMDWSRTGSHRVDDSGQFLAQWRNNFGRLRWDTSTKPYIASVCLLPIWEFNNSTSTTGAYQWNENQAATSGTGATQTTRSVGGVTNVSITEAVNNSLNTRVLEKCYAFANDNSRDPLATVQINWWQNSAAYPAYIYPAPRPDATVAVYNAQQGTASQIQGYARNHPLGFVPNAPTSAAVIS